MNDMKIVIACKDPTLRALAYSLLPWVDPRDLTSSHAQVEDIRKLHLGGVVDLIVTDENFHNAISDDMRDVLVRMDVPIVILRRRESQILPATVKPVLTRTSFGAAVLLVPTTVQGMEDAIKLAIDIIERREGGRHGVSVPPSKSKDYGRERLWPAADADPPFDAPPETFELSPQGPAPGHPDPLDQAALPAQAPVPRIDPIDGLVEAAKAIVAIAKVNTSIELKPDWRQTHVLIPKGDTDWLASALVNAGYGDA